MDNLPIGAANNPDAPYNKIPPREVDVRIEQTMVKETTAFLDDGDDYKENWWLDEIHDATLSEVLVRCEKIVKRLRRKHYFYAGVNLYDLEQDCHSWTEGKLNVELL